jgi:hypothetical protein
MNEALQERARATQSEFVSYMEGRASADPASWADPLLEMNPDVSRLFFLTCCLRAARETAARALHGGDWVIFADSAALRRALAACLPPPAGVFDAPWHARAASAIARFVYVIAHRVRLLADHMAGVRQSAGSLWSAAGESATSGRPLTLIFTWVHDRSFGSDGTFRDAFFIDLAERLRAAGENVRVVPRVMPGADRDRALRSMARSKTGFLIPFPFLPVRRVMRRLWDSFGDAFPRRRPWPPFAGSDICDLAAEDAARCGVYPRVAEALLFEDLVAGWKAAGLRIGRFIYPYENHGWERVLCGTLRRLFPDAVTVGYLHSRLPDVIPNYYGNPPGFPRPDVLVANGPGSHRRLLETGHDAASTLCRGTLRYRYLFTAAPAPAHAPGAPGRILAAFPIGEEEGRELFCRLREAFRETATLEVSLKFHPDNPAGRVLRGLSDRRLPSHFRVTDEPMADLVRRSDVMVYTTSTSSLEAAAAGVPSVHYVISCNLDGDPLGRADALRRDASSATDLKEAVEELARAGFPRIAPSTVRDFIRDNFGAPEDDIYPLFTASRPAARGRGVAAGGGGR